MVKNVRMLKNTLCLQGRNKHYKAYVTTYKFFILQDTYELSPKNA